MGKWVFRSIVLVVIAFGAYAIYDYYRAGLNTRPDMPPGAFSISFTTGMRAILVDVPNERDTRRYFGFPFEVPFYLEDTWSICSPPKMTEMSDAESFMSLRDFPGERFEVVCRIQVEDETVVRGIITTVPKL